VFKTGLIKFDTHDSFSDEFMMSFVDYLIEERIGHNFLEIYLDKYGFSIIK
jgi:hypothetical protein